MPTMHLLTDGPNDAGDVLVLAHGAGGAMDTPFMNIIARGVANCGIRVVRFEFPYMAARRATGKRGAPDREPFLLQTWRDVVAHLGGGEKVVIGGKSLGGRMASMVADEVAVRGLVCLGYPFHPPGQPQRLRTAHLHTLRTPALILQGTRDPFGSMDEVARFDLSSSVRVQWLRDGDHSFRPRAFSGVTERENLAEAASAVCNFVRGLH
jgi:predicted alpha/beta-hydrolase family hydrolase